MSTGSSTAKYYSSNKLPTSFDQSQRQNTEENYVHNFVPLHPSNDICRCGCGEWALDIFYKSFIYVNWIHQTINYTERMDQHVFEKLYAYREALKQINWQNVSSKIASANGVLFKASLFYAKQQSKEQWKGNVTLHIVVYKRSSRYKI